MALWGCAPAVDYAPVRFIAIGDTGEANQAQADVAAVIETVCADQGCDFVLLLGDNIYETGVDGVDDPQWQEKFELPYANIDLPFYAVLGNHDYGNLSADEALGAHQVAYTAVSDKWEMPDRWYSFVRENIGFYALDTQVLMFSPAVLEPDLYTPQVSWLQAQLDLPDQPRWHIGFGHHPYYSNGQHGNAGEYDLLPPGTIGAGQQLKDAFDDNLCGKLDLYLSGHDHDRQWHETTCDDTQFIVSGAGAKLREQHGDQPTHFQDFDTEGFAWLQVDDDDLTVQFWDRTGAMNHEGSFSKPEE